MDDHKVPPKAANTYKDFLHLTFAAPSFNAKNLPARLTFGLRNDSYPMISLYPNVDRSEEYKNPRTVCSVSVPPIEMEILLTRMEDLFKNAENGQSDWIEASFLDREKSKDRKVGDPITKEQTTTMGRFVFGKNAEGVCFIALKHDSIPNIPFYLKPSVFYTMKENQQDEAALSKAYALGLTAAVRRAYANCASVIRPPYDGPRKGGDTGGSAPKKSVTEDDDYQF